MNRRCAFSRILVFAGFVLVLSACTSTSPPQTSSTPTVDSAHLTAFAQSQPTYSTPLPTPIIANATNVGRMPTDCALGPSPTSRYLDSEFGPGVGGPWLWLIGDGPDMSLTGAHSYEHGWGVKALWVVGPHYTHPVTLRGGSSNDATPIWFNFGDGPTPSPLLDPLHPGTITASDHGWAAFPSTVFIPKAGCYYLEASWPGGSWRMPFAAGL